MLKAIDSRRLDDLLRRDHSLTGSILFGIEGVGVQIEARAVRVLPSARPWNQCTRISGMARGAIRESLDRITGAFSKYQIPDPRVEISINLAPADLPKEGTWLDLPVAIIMLQAAGFLPDLPDRIEGDYVLIGELGLHGDIRRVPGVLAAACSARAGQILVVPRENELECALVTASPDHKGCKVATVENLEEVMQFFMGKQELRNALGQRAEFEPAIGKAPDFGSIRGQKRAKRAAVICAAGGHNMLMVGPPGEGKSLLASALPGILPPLTTAEKIELTRIYSACGLLDRDGLAITRRPMREIHHSVSKQALVGGGAGTPRPGEVTLAHLGVLFLDEVAEFNRGALEALRQPMESGSVTISRVDASLSFPARFCVVAAMNPCPCGYHPDSSCQCTDNAIEKYQSKLSGPILDRIDLKVELSRLTVEERFSEESGESSQSLRQQVSLARQKQTDRYSTMGIPHNAAIPGGRVRELCEFEPDAFDRFKLVVAENTVSTRSMDRIAKVSRTIADLGGVAQVATNHVDEAASFVLGSDMKSVF
jgi:magnesium chelatase family protein